MAGLLSTGVARNSASYIRPAVVDERSQIICVQRIDLVCINATTVLTLSMAAHHVLWLAALAKVKERVRRAKEKAREARHNGDYPMRMVKLSMIVMMVTIWARTIMSMIVRVLNMVLQALYLIQAFGLRIWGVPPILLAIAPVILVWWSCRPMVAELTLTRPYGQTPPRCSRKSMLLPLLMMGLLV